MWRVSTQLQCLQAGISHSGGSYGVNNALLELHLGPQDRVEESQNQQLQSAIPGVRPIRQEKKLSPRGSNQVAPGNLCFHIFPYYFKQLQGLPISTDGWRCVSSICVF